MKAFLTLRGLLVAWFLGLLALVAALVQLWLGASPAVVGAALMAAIAGLIGFALLGAYNIGSWVALFYALGNVLIALYAKTLFGQSLGSNLYVPLNSFLAEATASIELLAALLLVRNLNVGRPLFKGVTDPRFLGFLSWACFGLGCTFWLLNRWCQDPSGSGFGGFSLFRDLLLMAVIARTAMLLELSDNRSTFDIHLALILVVSVVMGMIDNQKTMIALPVVSYFVTVLFYLRGIPARVLAAIPFVVVLFIFIVAPLTHYLRGLDLHNMIVRQRVELVTSKASHLLESPREIYQINRSVSVQFKNCYYDYFGGNGAHQMLLGRYAVVQMIDPVIAAVARQGTRGGEAIWPAFARLIPRFIYPEKPKNTEAYTTLVYYKLIDPAGGKFPTLPLAGQAYAAYGVAGLLLIPFVTFFGFLIVIKKIGWHLDRNLYAIFFLCSFVIVYVNQGDLNQYAAAALHDFPMFAIVFWLLAQLYRVRVRMERVPNSAESLRMAVKVNKD
jgi:hypothetical protein